MTILPHSPGLERALKIAKQTAYTLNSEYIKTESILAGLLANSSIEAFLAELGCDVEKTRKDINLLRTDLPAKNMPSEFTPKVKNVFEYANRYAQSLGSDQLYEEHLIYGLVSEKDGTAALILELNHFVLDAKKLRQRLNYEDNE